MPEVENFTDRHAVLHHKLECDPGNN